MLREAVIGVGTNVASRREQLHAAAAALRATEGIESVEIAPIFATVPIVPEGTSGDHPEYLNTIFVAETSLSPEVLMGRLLAIEASFGRRRDGTVSPRTIDLDLLLLGSERRDSPELTLPHPKMGERAFVQEPLRSIRPMLAAKRETDTSRNR